MRRMRRHFVAFCFFVKQIFSLDAFLQIKLPPVAVAVAAAVAVAGIVIALEVSRNTEA